VSGSATHLRSSVRGRNLFRTTTKVVKTQQVARSRGQRCGDIELAAYLADAAGPVSLVVDLCIKHERRGTTCNPVSNGNLHYPLLADIDKPLHDATAEKIREYRADYNNRPSHSISFMPAVEELSMRNITRTCSVSSALLSTPSSNLRLAKSSPESYVSTLTSMVLL
jgi:hypothetical protein